MRTSQCDKWWSQSDCRFLPPSPSLQSILWTLKAYSGNEPRYSRLAVQRMMSSLIMWLIKWYRLCRMYEFVPRYGTGCLASEMCGISYEPQDTLIEWPTEFSTEHPALDDRKDVGLIKIVSRARGAPKVIPPNFCSLERKRIQELRIPSLIGHTSRKRFWTTEP